MGSPIVGATVTLKDSAGNSSSATTASDGTYTLNTSGMTPPYFVQVVTTSGTTFYSVSADALASTTINSSVLTDMVVRTWFTIQGVNPNSAFANPVATQAQGVPLPSPLAVQTIAQTVNQVLQLWFNQAGITVTSSTPSGSAINFISSPYTANGTGLDAVLSDISAETVDPNTGAVTAIQITNGTTTQVSSTVYTANGGLTLNSTTTSGGAASSDTVTGSVPNTAQQNALNAIGIGTLSNYTLGQPVTFNWTLPQTFAIASVEYSITVFDFTPSSGGTGNQCGTKGSSVPNNTTSGTITIPAMDTCSGNSIKSINLDAVVMGVNGEMARATVFIQ